MLTFGSLFAGIGGIDLGFQRAGLRCQWQVEINEYATRVLAKHWPDVRRWDDVRTFPPSLADAGSGRRPNNELCAGGNESRIRRQELRAPADSDWRTDIIAAGFPCQDVSNAGSRDGIEGEKSGLFFEVERIVCLLRPKYIVLENVAALLVRGANDVFGALAASGYGFVWDCIPAASVGAPHIRDRVFIIAFSDGDNEGNRRRFEQSQSGEAPRMLANPDGVGRQRVAAGNGEEIELEIERRNDVVGCGNDASNANGSRRTQQRRGIATRSKFETVERYSWWKTEPGMDRMVDGVPRRVDRITGLGNAVVPQVAQHVAEQVLELDEFLAAIDWKF